MKPLMNHAYKLSIYLFNLHFASTDLFQQPPYTAGKMAWELTV